MAPYRLRAVIICSGGTKCNSMHGALLWSRQFVGRVLLSVHKSNDREYGWNYWRCSHQHQKHKSPSQLQEDAMEEQMLLPLAHICHLSRLIVGSNLFERKTQWTTRKKGISFACEKSELTTQSVWGRDIREKASIPPPSAFDLFFCLVCSTLAMPYKGLTHFLHLSEAPFSLSSLFRRVPWMPVSVQRSAHLLLVSC